MMCVGGKKEMRKGFWSWHGMRGRGVRAPDGPIWGPTLPHQPTTETQKTDQCKLLRNKNHSKLETKLWHNQHLGHQPIGQIDPSSSQAMTTCSIWLFPGILYFLLHSRSFWPGLYGRDARAILAKTSFGQFRFVCVVI